MSAHEKALNSIFDDMDDLETKKMFGDKPSPDSNKGVDITISILPKGGDDSEDYPEGHDEEMCKGGCAMHTGGTVPKPELEADTFSGYDGGDPEYKKGEIGMAQGGMIAEPERGETDDLTLPPFLRKKKKGI